MCLSMKTQCLGSSPTLTNSDASGSQARLDIVAQLNGSKTSSLAGLSVGHFRTLVFFGGSGVHTSEICHGQPPPLDRPSYGYDSMI